MKWMFVQSSSILQTIKSVCYKTSREKADETILVKQTENKEKCKHIMNHSYEKQEYIEKENICETRQLFSFRTRIGLQPFAV